MLINKCYVNARYRSDYADFIQISINDAFFLLYLGNLKNSQRIINRLKHHPYFNAVCRIHSMYEPEYPEFHPQITPELYQIDSFSSASIWLETVKITLKQDRNIEQGYFALRDSYQPIQRYIKDNPTLILPELSNKQQLITIHGTLNKSHAINPFHIVAIEDLAAVQVADKALQLTIPPELEKFFN